MVPSKMSSSGHPAITASKSSSDCGDSPALRGVSAITSGLPNASQATWIFVEKPPRLRPRASASAELFLTCGVLVGAHHRGVDHHPVRIGLLQRLKNSLPSRSFLDPRLKRWYTVSYRPKRSGRSSQGLPGASDPEHRVQEAAIVIRVAAWSAEATGKQLDPLVLLVGELVAASHRKKVEEEIQGKNQRMTRATPQCTSKDAASMNLRIVSTT